MPCRFHFRSDNQRKAYFAGLNARLKSSYSKHSNPCSYCNSRDCKTCRYNKLKNKGTLPLKTKKDNWWKTHI